MVALEVQWVLWTLAKNTLSLDISDIGRPSVARKAEAMDEINNLLSSDEDD